MAWRRGDTPAAFGARALVSAAVLGVLGACPASGPPASSEGPPTPASAPPPPIEVPREGSTTVPEALDEEEDAAKAASRERERMWAELLQEGVPTQGGPPDLNGLLRGTIRAWGGVEGIDASLRASWIRGALARPDDSFLLLLARPGSAGRARHWETWVLRGQGGTAERVDQQEIPSAAGAEPSVVALPGQGFLLVRSTDNVEQPGARVQFLVRRIGMDGTFETTSSVLSAPSGIDAFREWRAERSGDAATLCFAGRQRASGDAALAVADDDVFCGRVGWDGSWASRPRSVFRGVRSAPWAEASEVRAVGLSLGRSHDENAFVIFRVEGGGWDRYMGVFTATRDRAFDLMGEPVALRGAGRPRIAPMAVSGPNGTAWAVPGVGGSFARGGFIGQDGTMVAGLRQIPELGSWLDRPLMLQGDGGALLLYDDYGLTGFRTFAFWEWQAPESGSMPPPLGAGPRERAARNGWADDDWIVLVTSEPDAFVVVGGTQPLVGAGVVQRVPDADDGPADTSEPGAVDGE